MTLSQRDVPPTGTLLPVQSAAGGVRQHLQEGREFQMVHLVTLVYLRSHKHLTSHLEAYCATYLVDGCGENIDTVTYSIYCINIQKHCTVL